MKRCDEQWIKDMQNGLLAAFNAIKDVMHEVFGEIEEFIFEKKEPVEHFYNWHVPQKITRNHQVIDRKPKLARIRNHI